MNSVVILSVLVALFATLAMLWAKRQIKNQQSRAAKQP